jgi:hypothetical protein
MKYLFWGILNMGLIFWLIKFCLRLVNKNLKTPRSTILFYFILIPLSLFVLSGKSKQPRGNQWKVWRFYPKENLKNTKQKFLNIELESTLSTKFNLGLNYAEIAEKNQVFPLVAFSTLTGFVSGIAWKPHFINVSISAKQIHFKYEVLGVVQWKLLGIVFYAEPKDYEGSTFLREKITPYLSIK